MNLQKFQPETYNDDDNNDDNNDECKRKNENQTWCINVLNNLKFTIDKRGTQKDADHRVRNDKNVKQLQNM